MEDTITYYLFMRGLDVPCGVILLADRQCFVFCFVFVGIGYCDTAMALAFEVIKGPLCSQILGIRRAARLMAVNAVDVEGIALVAVCRVVFWFFWLAVANVERSAIVVILVTWIG